MTIHTDHEAFAPYTRAELLWGLYERTEISFIRTFLRGSAAVIELGAGLGVASAHIASQMQPGGRLVSVEANPRVLEIARRNIEANAERAGVEGQLVHAALANSRGEARFVIEDNLFASHLEGTGATARGATTTIRTVSLESLREEFAMESFDLVCDVEGAEAQFIVGSDPGLDRCRRLVIELHACSCGGESYSVGDLLEALRRRWAFRTLAVKGDVAALERG